jgi:enamine deaminase RidA (YjgF/YER057c/UK114 family)
LSSTESRLASLGIDLGTVTAPVANFVPTVISDKLLFVSGQICFSNGKVAYTGQLGSDRTLEEGQAAARLCAINILAHARAALGSLDKIARVVQLQGFVNAAVGFTQHPAVINGASDLIVELFGEAGKHSRFAVGVSSLPFNAAVEVAAIFEVRS